MITLALWDEAVLDYFSRAAFELSENIELNVVRAPRRECRDLVINGKADVGLVPTLDALKERELFDVASAVSISTWDNPFVKLLIKSEANGAIKSVAINPYFTQEAIIARILLKEHYNAEPVFHPTLNASIEELQQASVDASLLVYHDATDIAGQENMFDVGRDWFELTHYPMVWGVFVTNRGTAKDELIRTLRTIAQYSELYSQAWASESDLPEMYKAFYGDGIRYRMDDLAVAGLTSLQDYLYYNNALEDMGPLSFYELEQDEDDDDQTPLL